MHNNLYYKKQKQNNAHLYQQTEGQSSQQVKGSKTHANTSVAMELCPSQSHSPATKQVRPNKITASMSDQLLYFYMLIYNIKIPKITSLHKP